MQIILILVLIFWVVFLTPYIQWRYAKENYPKSWKWKSLLFAVGGGLGGIAFMTFNPSWRFPQAIFVFIGGILFAGLCFTWLFPEKMRFIIPPK
jgi:hypothetical protein